MPPQLLLIEDDPDSREMLALLLEAYGFEVMVAEQSRVARRHLAHAGFDLVLADLMVDSRDPTVSWRTIHELVELAKPSPVGLLTSWPVKEQQVSDHGLAFALAKPCSSETLLSFIANFLGLPKLTEAQERAIREYFLHLDARDYRALSDLCTEDVIYRLPSTGETVCGRGAFRAHAERTFTPLSSATFTLREIRPLPTGALAHYTGRWTEGDGQRSLDGVVAFRFANELICEIGVRIDLARARPVH